MKNYQYILFDLDGTLTDSGDGIINSVAYSLDKLGVPFADRAQLYRFIGPPLVDSYEEIFGFSHEKAQTAVEYYREYYRDRGIYENSVYDGIEDVLKRLSAAGRTLLVATAKPEEFANRILDHFHLTHYFSEIVGATFDGVRLRKDQVIAHAIALGGITDVTNAVMIGDREHDVLGAKKYGMDCIGVLFGYGSREELNAAGAAYIAETPGDIASLLL